MLVTRGTWKVKEVGPLKSLRSCRSPFLGDDWEKGPCNLQVLICVMQKYIGYIEDIQRWRARSVNIVLPLENIIHMFKPRCNVFFII